ncbi:hypothetical protein F0344_34590 (plasmid) [Streptomyces finlayi]|uniref:Uncharacterized protein n=1 Tax=Streptomyces finlayi TaxID=67296 RepID=A0A7G7BW78_9ACTN|nr:hypothetical protein [Streptomyces finlayi]QNE79593.1 hypothetical protein F0344_34590 [Streptomyces finlayi]
MNFTSSTEGDMEIFLSVVGTHLGKIGAETVLDLYVDTAITDPAPERVLEEMIEEARSAQGPASARRGDPLMAVPLDLHSQRGLERFSLLAHRTIGCEASVGAELVFSTVENERIVCLDLPQGDVEALEAEARLEGAKSLIRVA